MLDFCYAPANFRVSARLCWRRVVGLHTWLRPPTGRKIRCWPWSQRRHIEGSRTCVGHRAESRPPASSNTAWSTHGRTQPQHLPLPSLLAFAVGREHLSLRPGNRHLTPWRRRGRSITPRRGSRNRPSVRSRARLGGRARLVRHPPDRTGAIRSSDALVASGPATGDRAHGGAGRASAGALDGSRTLERRAGRDDGGSPDAPARHGARPRPALAPRLRRRRQSRNQTARGTRQRPRRCRHTLIRRRREFALLPLNPWKTWNGRPRNGKAAPAR